MAFYQHSDEVIRAARVLKKELLNDSLYGNEDHAEDWFYKNYAQVGSLANQKLEEEIK